MGILFNPNAVILLIDEILKPKMSLNAEQSFVVKMRIKKILIVGPFTKRTTHIMVKRLLFLHKLDLVNQDLATKSFIKWIDIALIAVHNEESTHSDPT